MIPQALAWLIEFFQDDAGNKSSSRLIAIGGASAMAVYLLAGGVLQHFGLTTGDAGVASDCVWAMAALGGVVYGANRIGKKQAADGGE